MKVLDLFSGAGGFSLGFKRAGFEIALAIENFPKNAETFKQNFPESKVIVEDIRKIKTSLVDFKPFVIIGGPPCEPYTLINPKREKSR